jgi:hypothetical protein
VSWRFEGGNTVIEVQAPMLHGLSPNGPAPYTRHDFEIALKSHHWLTQTDFNLGRRYRRRVKRRVAT